MSTHALIRSRTLAAVLLAAGVAIPGCGQTEDISVTEARLQIVAETAGRGRTCRDGDVVCIDYRVLLPDGAEVMWAKEFCFELGAGAVIAGIDGAVPGMNVGGKRIVQCPAHLHWGSGGYGKGDKAIPPDTTLTLDIKLTSID